VAGAVSGAAWSVELLRHVARNAERYEYWVDRCDPVKGLIITKSSAAPRLDHETMIIMGLVGTWVRSGLPTVRIENEKRLTRLGVSKPEQRPAEPWEGWLIEYPRDQRTVMLLGSDGNADPVRMTLVINVSGLWSYFSMCHRVDFSEFGRTAEYLRDSVPDAENCWKGMATMPVTPEDRRAWQLMNNVVLNSAIALGEIEGVRRQGPERAGRVRGRYPAGDYVLEAVP